MIKSTDMGYTVIILVSIHKNRNINLTKPDIFPSIKNLFGTIYFDVFRMGLICVEIGNNVYLK